MRIKRLMTAALGGLAMACQGPAAVLAQEAAASGPATALPAAHAAITREHRAQALDTLDRRLAHYVMADRTPALRARLAERRAALLEIADPEAFRQAINADLLDVSGDKHLQVWLEPRSRDEVAAAGPPPSMEQLGPRGAAPRGGGGEAHVGG